MAFTAFSLSVLASLAYAQLEPASALEAVAESCGPSTANVVCINRFASVLPYHFFREPNRTVSFGQTSVPNDTSFSLVQPANFLVFDKKRGLEVLGDSPTYDYMFDISQAVHEAPVYVPSVNKLFFSTLAPPAGTLPQLVVDLNQDPPTLSEFLSDPPVYAPNGGTFHNGLVYWGASGGNTSIGGTEQRPGIRTLDPLTNKTTTLLNNYYGFYFNCVNDLFVDPSTGYIWFTDPQYSWFNALVDTPPQLRPATYRFDPQTGEVSIVDDSLQQPNGIALSPDGKNVYIASTGASNGDVSPSGFGKSTRWNQTAERAVYKYDVVDGGKAIINKRPIWYSQEGVPDGLKVAENGLVVTATGKGIDVFDPTGSLIVRIQTSFPVQNFAWTGKDLKELWMMGNGGLARVRWNLAGQDLAAPPFY